MSKALTSTWALTAGLWLAACASPASSPFRDPSLSMPAASQSMLPGQTTKAEVLATLGPATQLSFDSGFEVWVYRGKSGPAAAAPAGGSELVVLFSPAGVVSKTRIRPFYAAP